MPASLNRFQLIGNLTRDPELRHTPKGTAVADLGIAVNARVPDGSGGWQDKTTFLDITVWGNNAENAAKYLRKGRPVFAEGRMEVDSWDDKETGKKRHKLKLVAETLQYLPSSKKAEKPETLDTSPSSSPPPQNEWPEDDDIPF